MNEAKKWRVNFSIGHKSIYFDVCMPYARLILVRLPPKDGRQLCAEFVVQYQDGMMRGLVPCTVVEETIHWIKEKIISEPEWADDLHLQTEAVNREFFDYAEEVRRMDLSKLTNSELGNVARRLHVYQGDAHTRSLATTWFVDCDGEKFSAYLRDVLQAYLEKADITDPARRVDIFILLTTPTRSGRLQDEQNEFLTLVKRVQQTPARKVFEQFNTASEMYCHLPKEIQQSIHEHYEKWRWIPYGYIGPAYALEHYVDEMQKTLASDVNVTELLAHEEKRLENVAREQSRIVEKLMLPPDVQHLFAIARDIIWLKDYRKLCQFHGFYVLHIVCSEVAKRLNLTLKQTAHFFDHEIMTALESGEADHDLLNQRMEHSVAYITPEKVTYLYGSDADQFMSRIEIEQTSLDASGELRGSCACPGVVEGEVKIVNTVEDMPKMRAGDIMAAHTTFPALVPAMKKAAAIITEDGGITCHAAIVAREFRIPCVVGIRDILTVVRDGDRLQVDATNGIIKKI